MEQQDEAEPVVLKCVNALELHEEIPSNIRQLSDGRIFARLLACMTNESVEMTDMVSLVPSLEDIIKEHFAGPNLIDFEKVVCAENLELTKLTLVLIYIGIMSEAKLRNKLINSHLMDQDTQLKIRHLIESIQKRGSGISTKFLNILCSEKIAAGRCQTPVTPTTNFGSPHIFSSSPKARFSPLRELVHSPPFRLQKLLNAKAAEVKKLNQKIHKMEYENQELEANAEFGRKRIAKQASELSKAKEEIQKLRCLRDELEAKMVMGEDTVQKEMLRISRELSQLRKDNAALTQTIHEVSENNDEVTTKNESLHKRLVLTQAERDQLQAELARTVQAKIENENYIDSQAHQIKEVKEQCEELKCLLECHKPVLKSIEESFEGNESPPKKNNSSVFESPMQIGTDQGNVSGEVMADVIDKILQETKTELEALQIAHDALKENLSQTICSRDQLLTQVESLSSENESIALNLTEVRESHSQLCDAHAELQKRCKENLQHIQELDAKNEDLESFQQKLQGDLDETRKRIHEQEMQKEDYKLQLTESRSQMQCVEKQMLATKEELETTSSALQLVTQEKSIALTQLTQDFENQHLATVAEHQQKVDELNHRITLLTSELESLKQEAEKMKDVHHAAISELKSQLQNVKEENESLNLELQLKSETSMRLQEELDSKLLEFEEQKTSLNRDIQESKESYQRLTSDSDKCIAKLSEEKEVLNSALSTLQQDMKTTVDNLMHEKNDLRKELDLKSTSVVALQQQLEEETHKWKQENLEQCHKMEHKDEALALLEKQRDELVEKETLLSKALETKEEMIKQLQEEMQLSVDAHTKEKAVMSDSIQALQRDLEETAMKSKEGIQASNDEKSKLEHEILAKESTFSSLQRKLEDSIRILNEEKVILSKTVEEKSKALDSAELEMKDVIDIHRKELAEKELAISKLQEEIEEKEQQCNSTAEQLEKLNSAQESIASKNERLESELQAVKDEMKVKVSEISKSLTNTQQDMVSNINDLTRIISERDEALNLLKEQKEEHKQRFENEVTRLHTELKQRIDMIQTMEGEYSKIKAHYDERESEYNSLKSSFASLQNESSKQMGDHNDLLKNHQAMLEEKSNNLIALKEEFQLKETELRSELGELQKKEEDLRSAMQEKEEDMARKIASLKQEMDSVAQEKLASENKLTEVKTVVALMEKEHTRALDQLRVEAKLQQESFDTKAEALKETVTRLEREKAEATQEATNLKSSLELLTNDIHEKTKTLSSLEATKEENDEIFLQERTAANEIIKAQEKALDALKQEVENALEEHKSEAVSLQRQIKEKSAAYDSLKNEMETALAAAAKDQSELKLQIQEKEEKLINMEHQMLQIKGEKASIISEFQMKENANVTLKQEMEKNLETVVNGKDTEIRSKEEFIRRLQNEKEEVHEAHKKEKASLEDRIKEQEHSLLSLEKQLQTTVDKYLSEKESLLQKNESKQKELEVLQEDLTKTKATLTGDLKAAEEQLSHVRNEKAEAKKKSKSTIENLEDEIEKKSLLITSLQAELEKIKSLKEAQMGELEQKCIAQKEAVDKEIATLSEQLAKQTEENDHLQTKLKRMEIQSDTQKSKIDMEMQKQEKAKLESEMLENKLVALEKEKLQKTSEKEEGIMKLADQVTKLEKMNEATLQKLKAKEAEAEKYKNNLHTVEAKLIDREKQVTAAEEERMRVERESDQWTRSLKEELKAAKEKSRAEKLAAIEKVKATFKTEVEKMMLHIKEKEQVSKDCEILQHKYEEAKRKLTEMLTELNEVRSTKDHYQNQMSKYKEHVTKLTESLRKEEAIKAELQEMHQPYKEKLREYEQTIKRLCTEKRSLEAQFNLADSQVREMKKQLQQPYAGSFSRGPTKRSRTSASETNLTTLKVSRPSTSSASTEDDVEFNNSKEKLLRRGGMPKRRGGTDISRSVSSETVFRKPGQGVGAERKPRSSVSVASALGSSTNQKRITSPVRSMTPVDKSLGRSVPRDMLFNCEDEEELFSNKYLMDMKVGLCVQPDPQWKRLSELQRRNSLYPPHMRSAYPGEMQGVPLEDFEEDKLRAGCAVEERHLLGLTQATENLELNSPAYNLRKRKSLSDSQLEIFTDSYSGGKKSRRFSTSYSRPGPPTPGRRSSGRGDQENRNEQSYSSQISSSSVTSQDAKVGSPQSLQSTDSPVSMRTRHQAGARASRPTYSPSSRSFSRSGKSPGNLSVVSKKGASPHGKKGFTPSSLRKILARGKSPWRKLENENETPTGHRDSSGSTGSSKLRIFRKPFGSRNYNVLSASLRAQENPQDPNDSSSGLTKSSDTATTKIVGRSRRIN